jgi:hypothetical protein
MSTVARRDPGDRWRLFAVAACAGAVKSQQEVGLYVELLRARQALTQIQNLNRPDFPGDPGSTFAGMSESQYR